ncbi:MAG: hypothetical protein HN948_07635 [Clostridia bacterium]|jgi:biotin-(acetyl-CoA carboxylase) ligase|nr:hypothetical protein [Clostridia bacterium]MBT7122866.1 hypothetical protein [Clostridia bacterium]
MSDQNNNIPEKPIQPFPFNSQQNYDPQTGQPAYQPYTGSPVPPQKKKSKWWIWLIVAVVVIGLVIAALFIFDVFGPRRAGNEGVWAAYDYIDSLEARQESVVGASHKELVDRLNTEAFEIDGEIEIDSELIGLLDMGFNQIGADFKVKYDFVDLGLQLNLMSFISADLYLIEDEVVISLFGQAYSLPLELDTDADLGDEMSLEARIAALTSMSQDQDFDGLLLRVITEFAPAVADNLSEHDTADVYSPKEDDEVQMNTITTTIDEDDLYDIVTGFGENLEANEELIDDLQALVDTLADAAGEDIDIEDLLDDMMDMDEDEYEDIPKFEFSWTVYKYKGEYVGIGLYIEAEDEEVEALIITEFSSDTVFTSIVAEYDGDEVLSALGELVYSGDDMTFDMEIEITIPEDEYTEEMAITVDISGETTIEKDSNTEYAFSGDLSIDIEGVNMYMLGIPDTISVDITVSADVLFGDLETIEDDDDWNDVYDQDWGDIDDLMNGLNNLPFDLPF